MRIQEALLSSTRQLLCNALRASIPAVSLACFALPAHAQPVPASTFVAAASLPDSPGADLRATVLSTAAEPALDESSSSAPFFADPAVASGQSLGHNSAEPASPQNKYIDPGQRAPALTASDKVRLGLRDAVSPFAVIGWVASAAYSQAVDGAPNYGQGWGPFAQRFGASAARAGTEGVLSDSVFAPVFHEDPRYYRLGPGTNLVHRTVYAVTRTVITRSDSGRSTPNFALIAGNAAGSVLANAYYPDRNRDAKTTAETFAGSIGGSALGFFVSEFLSDALGIIHLK